MKRDIERERYLKAFGDTLRALRTQRGVAQVDLAILTGISQGSMSRYEQGMTCPDVYEFRRIAIAIGRTAPELAAIVELMFEGSEMPVVTGTKKGKPEPMRLWRTRKGVVVVERDRVVEAGAVKIAAYRQSTGAWHGWLSLKRLRTVKA